MNVHAQRSRLGTVVALLMLASTSAACGSREHMSDDYGRKSRVFFAKQHVHADSSTGSPAGLDSEEASLIQGSYRRNVGGAAAQTGPKDPTSRVLLLEDSDRGKNAE